MKELDVKDNTIELNETLKKETDTKIADLEAELNRLRAKIEDLHASLSAEKQTSSDYKHQNENNITKIEELKKIIDDLNEKLKAAEEIQKKLDQMIIDEAVYKKDAEFLKYQIENKKERITELQEALKNLQDQLQNEQDKSRAAFEENMNTVENLKSELNAKVEAEKNLSSQVEKLKSENQQLADDFKNKTEELSEANENHLL